MCFVTDEKSFVPRSACPGSMLASDVRRSWGLRPLTAHPLEVGTAVVYSPAFGFDAHAPPLGSRWLLFVTVDDRAARRLYCTWSRMSANVGLNDDYYYIVRPDSDEVQRTERLLTIETAVVGVQVAYVGERWMPYCIGTIVYTGHGAVIVRWELNPPVLELYDLRRNLRDAILLATRGRVFERAAEAMRTSTFHVTPAREVCFDSLATFQNPAAATVFAECRELLIGALGPCLRQLVARHAPPPQPAPSVPQLQPAPRVLPPQPVPVPVPAPRRALLALPASRAPAVPAQNEGAACVVCLTNERDYLCMPCRHVAFCDDCVEAACAASRICPICRAPLDEVFRVHL